MKNTYRLESDENPKLLEIYVNQAWHQVFCYALAFEKVEGYGREDKILFTIVSGSDSALQSLKAAIDIGTRSGIRFGYGEKTSIGFEFKGEKALASEKGKYTKFPMTLSQNRKALAIVHESVLNNSEYVLAFNSNPVSEVSQLLGGSTFGLHILPEWEQPVLNELMEQKHLVEHDVYYDDRLFENGLSLLSINLEEEAADRFIENMIKERRLQFPDSGTGEKVEEITDLTGYLMEYNEPMVQKLSDRFKPTHNPIHDPVLPSTLDYPRELFPVQGHSVSAVAKRLQKQKAVIIQGEMSTGKSSMMTAIADAYHSLKAKKGYFAALMCPPSLTKKWPLEIKEILPDAEVHVIEKSAELISYHRDWMRKGRKKPTKPTFFIISFTTMRGDARTVPAVTYRKKAKLMEEGANAESGFFCHSCGLPHQVVEDEQTHINEDGFEEVTQITHNMESSDFGTSRRLNNGASPANAFCYHCGDSLWSKKVVNRYDGFKDWTTHEKKILHAVHQNNPNYINHLQANQKKPGAATGMPRRIAAIEYIRRKMNNFFDISLVDEVHELKGGMTAQGNALGSLAQASKKIVAGTGTLFGGKAEDVYFLLWRMFPNDMASSGFSYEEVTKFNEEYGNIEETTYSAKGESSEYSNTNSRGGDRRSTKKVVPGISPFIYGQFLIQNVINVRLKDVWPDPVDLVDTPTIFVPMTEEMKSHYDEMIWSFEHAIDSWDNGNQLYTRMTDYGIAYPDNPFNFPDAVAKNIEGERELIWEARHLAPSTTLPKEAKLQEIIQSEMAEGRKSIVYVKDTGSSVAERDVRPRLQQKLEEIGAKVFVLDTSSTKTNNRSDYLKKKIEKEGYDVCIVSQELVKVGLDLLCTPTLIYYQFSWSLFTINQSAKRAWRIGQEQECRLFYLAYEECYQETMAELIAKKNRATAAINGDVSSDGLSAMLGDEGDLQTMLIQSVKKGGAALKGSAEEWINQTSDRARELLAGIGKKKKAAPIEQFKQWVNEELEGETTKAALIRGAAEYMDFIEQNLIPGFSLQNGQLHVDLEEGTGLDRAFFGDGAILFHLSKPLKRVQSGTKEKEREKKEYVPAAPIVLTTHETKTKRTKKKVAEGQWAFDLFG